VESYIFNFVCVCGGFFFFLKKVAPSCRKLTVVTVFMFVLSIGQFISAYSKASHLSFFLFFFFFSLSFLTRVIISVLIAHIFHSCLKFHLCLDHVNISLE